MCNYTAQEIAEALRECHAGDCRCENCPMCSNDDCEKLEINAADMIDALLDELEKTKAERDKLETVNHTLRTGMRNLEKAYTNVCTERDNLRLGREKDISAFVQRRVDAAYAQGKADAYEEVAHRFFAGR